MQVKYIIFRLGGLRPEYKFVDENNKALTEYKELEGLNYNKPFNEAFKFKKEEKEKGLFCS